MKKPRVQFGLKFAFATTTGAALLMLIVATVRAGAATAFGKLLAACILCGIAALIFGYIAATILYLAFLITVLVFEPAPRRPTLVQFKRAAWMMVFSAIGLAGAFAGLLFFAH